MADFKTHITVSTTLGVGYAAVAYRHFDMPPASCALAGVLCSLSGMLPDLDSDSGVPLRESLTFAAACVPVMVIPRFEHLGWPTELIVLSGALIYIAVRFGFGTLLKKYTVHRGMFHSIPAALIAGELAFLLCVNGEFYLRAFKACAVVLGFMSHLILDEIWSVRVAGGQFGLKSSAGTAMKLWGSSGWANLSCYGKLIALGVLVLNDPIWTTVSPEGNKLHTAAATIVKELETRAKIPLPHQLNPQPTATAATQRPQAPSPAPAASPPPWQPNYAAPQYPAQNYAAQPNYGYPPATNSALPYQGMTSGGPNYGAPSYQAPTYPNPNYPNQQAYSAPGPQPYYGQPQYPPAYYPPQQQYVPPANYATPYPQQNWQQPAAVAPLDPRVQLGPMTKRY